MKPFNLNDAITEANFDCFIEFFEQDKVNSITSVSTLNSLELALVKGNNLEDRIKIVEYLINAGIDVNYIDQKNKRNALHYLFSNITKANVSFYCEVINALIKNGINVNQKDTYGAIPLSYAIANVKLDSKIMKPVYLLLLENGSDYNDKDNYGNSCLDYAIKFPWRNEFIEFVKEYEHGNK